jgi:hypothetical protein
MKITRRREKDNNGFQRSDFNREEEAPNVVYPWGTAHSLHPAHV